VGLYSNLHNFATNIWYNLKPMGLWDKFAGFLRKSDVGYDIPLMSPVPTYIVEEGATEFKPLTKEFIENCIEKTMRWAVNGQENDNWLDLSKPLDCNSDFDGSPFIIMIDNVFVEALKTRAEAGDIFNIFSNAMTELAAFSSKDAIFGNNRQEIIDFFVQERTACLNKCVMYSPQSQINTEYDYLISRVSLGCLDKLTELMLGRSVASEIARESGRGLNAVIEVI
jgi:hypothetical protein